MAKSLNACVDWLQVTFKLCETPHKIISYMGLNSADFIEFEKGKYGYDSQMRLGNIAFYYNRFKPVYEVHMEMTGQGCREYESMDIYSLLNLIRIFFEKFEINVSRLDLAIDDRQGFFTVSTIERKIQKVEYKGRFKTARVLTEYKLSTGDTVGKTCYFGSPKSDIQVRIYDKYQQMLKLKRDLPEGVDSWVRTELQLRDDRAVLAARAIAFDNVPLNKVALGILKNYINFVKPVADKNKSRWPIAPFWDKFLNGVDAIKLTSESPEASIERAREWIDRSVSATFSLLVEAYGYAKAQVMIRELLENGREKRSKKHENMLARYRAEQKIHEKKVLERKSQVFEELTKSHKEHRIAGTDEEYKAKMRRMYEINNEDTKKEPLAGTNGSK